MTDEFYKRPILNSPYVYPGRHWELDDDNQPTNRIADSRRGSRYITPVPKSNVQVGDVADGDIHFLQER